MMVKKSFAELQLTKNGHRITEETDPVFLYTLQHGLLLALREQKQLNEMQYRSALNKLKSQQANYARKQIRE